MATVNFKGQPVKTIGKLPEVGSKAPEFTLVAQDLSEINLGNFAGKKKIINIVPSLDTGVCATSAKKFQEAIRKEPDAVLISVSMDLPFAQSRFCKSESVDQKQVLSCFRSSFPKDYGVQLIEGPLKGLCSRAVVVLDKDNKVIYVQQVPEITQEPDYDSVMKSIKK